MSAFIPTICRTQIEVRRRALWYSRRLSGSFYAVHNRDGLWYPLSAQPQAFNVKFNGLRNQPARIFERGAGGDATREIRNISAPVTGRLFKNYRVFHRFNPACLRIEFSVPGSQVVTFVTRNCDSTRLDRVDVLPMVPACAVEPPPVLLQLFEHVADLHDASSLR